MYSNYLAASALLLLSALSHAEVTTVYVTKYAIATGTDGSFRVSANSTASSSPAAQTTLSLFNACSASGDNSTDSCTDSDITYYGAVVAADPTATIFAIDCAAHLNSTACASQTVTVTQGPSTFARVQTFPGASSLSDGSDPGTETLSVSCAITSSTQAAVCWQVDMPASAGAPAATGSGSAKFATNSANGTAAVPTVTMSFAAAEIHYNTLVITAGSEKLENATPTRTPVSPSSPTNVGTQPTKKPNAAASSREKLGASLAGAAAFVFAAFML